MLTIKFLNSSERYINLPQFYNHIDQPHFIVESSIVGVQKSENQ